MLALLILGQAVVNTGSLNAVSRLIAKLAEKSYRLSLVVTLIGVMVISAFINNTPTTVVFIPIMLAIASQAGLSASKVMMPLSYASILGGTTVLIGSSTNLLVAGVVVTMGFEPMGLFDFSFPGIIIAIVGLAFIIFIQPRLMIDRAPLSSELMGDAQRQFVIQLEVDVKSSLIGKSLADENLLSVDDVTIKMLQRHEHAYLAPFADSLTVQPFDVIVFTTTKQTLVELLAEREKLMFGKIAALNPQIFDGDEDNNPENMVMSEILIAPNSRMIGQNIEQIGFYHNTHCTVLGIQRRSRMITSRMTEIRLAAGDVLLVMGNTENIEQLRSSEDYMVMEWSSIDLPSKGNARRVNLIFGCVIFAATILGVPIYIAASVGAIAMILSKAMNIRQAARAIDGQIIMLVAAGIALGTALQVTGGAAFLAENLVDVMHGSHPVLVMSALFLLMGVATNVLSNNATALIFTPIAINTAEIVDAPVAMFIHAVIFASNCCSFASPIGYQTNLLVMGPGHYKFADYLRAGIPLSIIIWITYAIFSYYYYY